MASFVHRNRLLGFTSPLGEDKLMVERFSGADGVSELFRFEIDLLAEPGTTVDPKQIVGQKVCLSILMDGLRTKRFFNGIVSSFEASGGDDEFLSYHITMVPKLWLLTLNSNIRVFQDKTVLDIIKAVLEPYGISPTEDTSGTYATLDYCTQYRETDFQFISRLMEQYGILYYFDHTEDDHKLVLQDTSTKLKECAHQSSFRFSPQGSHREGYYDFVVEDFRSRSTLVTGKHSVWDYSFVRYMGLPPSGDASESTAGPLGSNSHEQYDYADSAAAYLKKLDSDGNIGGLAAFFNKVRRDSSDAETLLMEGASNAISMQTGYTFTLVDHQHSGLNGKYLALHMEHKAQQVPSYRSKLESPQPYVNSFTAIPFAIVYRPPILTPKPQVNGMHIAKVVTNQEEDSHMDKYGRACVQFFWDRTGHSSGKKVDNTWVRIAQQWAGKGWGTYFWPRVGDEVLIDFLEGDPDQPIVVGSLYNGVNVPKYDPTGQYTLSGVLTQSSKDGGDANANELRFEDLKGKEQIFMNAERDYDLHVEHDWHSQVDNEQHVTVTSNRFDQVGGDAHFLTKGKHLEEIDGEAHLNIKGKNVVQIGGDREHNVTGNLKESFGQNSHISVGMNRNESVGENYSLTVGMKQAIQAGMNFDVTAPVQISLNCGPYSVVLSPEGIGLNGPTGFISVGPSGVTISGVMVMINSGGAPVMGSPGSAQSPQSPGSATAPTAPKWPGDTPPSSAAGSESGSAGTQQALAPASAASAATPPKPPSPPPAAAAASEAAKGAQEAANEAKKAATEAEQAVKKTEQEAQAAVQQVVQQGRQAFNQANQAVQQAEQKVGQAMAQGQAAAQQALNQAKQQAQQTAQQAAQAVQQAQKAAEQVQQQAQQTAQQAQQAAQQAQQQAQQAMQQAQQTAQQTVQQGQQAVQQVQQQAQQTAQQAQQAAQQAQQQAQQAAQQAQQAAQQAQQQAQQAAQQVQQQAQQTAQQAQQSAQAAQQSANQAISQASRGF